MILENSETVKKDMMAGRHTGLHKGSVLWAELEESGYEYIPSVGWINRRNNTQLIQIPNRKKINENPKTD